MANKVPLTLLAALPLVLRSSLGTAGQYQGMVVDADTGQPIDGAAVVIVWYKETCLAFPGDAAEHLHAVKETVTDSASRSADQQAAGALRSVAVQVPAPRRAVIADSPDQGRPFRVARTDSCVAPARIRLQLRSASAVTCARTPHRRGRRAASETSARWCTSRSLARSLPPARQIQLGTPTADSQLVQRQPPLRREVRRDPRPRRHAIAERDQAREPPLEARHRVRERVAQPLDHLER